MILRNPYLIFKYYQFSPTSLGSPSIITVTEIISDVNMYKFTVNKAHILSYNLALGVIDDNDGDYSEDDRANVVICDTYICCGQSKRGFTT